MFDPLAPGFFDDPYPHYARLRETEPVHTDDRGVAFCFAYEDVRAVLTDGRRTTMEPPRGAPPTFPLGVLNRDPPDHTRLRRLLARAFGPRQIERLTDAMQRHVDRLLAALVAEQRETGGPVDLVAGLAFPFPFEVVSELLGMPARDGTEVRDWAHAITRASDPIVGRERVAAAHAAYRDISDYVRTEVVPWKRAHLRDDLLSLLLTAESDGQLSLAEVIDNVTLLYVAGHETTSGLIGNSVGNLLRHRDQLERLRAEPRLLANAVEELNRYESSVQLAWRYAAEDLTVGGVEVRRGATVFLCCGAANRDPARFGPTAAQLDIARSDARDGLSFGAGVHYCLGAALARREAMLVIDTLMRRRPALDLAGPPCWDRRMTFRALDHLLVTL